MSSARGAAGAVKPKLHNVNTIYAGKNQNAVKAPSTYIPICFFYIQFFKAIFLLYMLLKCVRSHVVATNFVNHKLAILFYKNL